MDETAITINDIIKGILSSINLNLLLLIMALEYFEKYIATTAIIENSIPERNRFEIAIVNKELL